jgi:hypothetical protein
MMPVSAERKDTLSGADVSPPKLDPFMTMACRPPSVDNEFSDALPTAARALMVGDTHENVITDGGIMTACPPTTSLTSRPEPAAGPVVQVMLVCVLDVTVHRYSTPVGPNVTTEPAWLVGPKNRPAVLFIDDNKIIVLSAYL